MRRRGISLTLLNKQAQDYCSCHKVPKTTACRKTAANFPRSSDSSRSAEDSSFPAEVGYSRCWLEPVNPECRRPESVLWCPPAAGCSQIGQQLSSPLLVSFISYYTSKCKFRPEHPWKIHFLGRWYNERRWRRVCLFLFHRWGCGYFLLCGRTLVKKTQSTFFLLKGSFKSWDLLSAYLQTSTNLWL